MLVSSLEEMIQCKRVAGKEAMARRGEFCLQKLNEFLKGSDFPMNEISRGWVEAFAGWMRDTAKLSENTVSNYLRTLLNLCRTEAKRGADIDLKAFDSAFLGYVKSGKHMISLDDFQKITVADFGQISLLAKVRDMFVFSVLCGGLTPYELIGLRKSDIRGEYIYINSGAGGVRRVPICDEAIAIMDRIGNSDGEYVFMNHEGGEEESQIRRQCSRYLGLLDVIADKARLAVKLTGESAAELWRSVARDKEIPEAVIATVGGGVNIDESRGVTASDVRLAINKVSAALRPEQRLWFAMKCIVSSPVDLAKELENPVNAADTFIPEIERMQIDKNGEKRKITQNIIGNTLFFRCRMRDAIAIKRNFRPVAYVYDYSTDEGRFPIVIPTSDMKMFMYINGIEHSKIKYFFPDEMARAVDLEEMDEVRVTEGKWKGAKGKYLGPNSESELMVDVAVEFPQLGIVVTAPIEKRFLKRI